MRFYYIKSFLKKNCGYIIIYLLLLSTYLFSLQYQPVTLTVEMKTSTGDTGQLFYNTGWGYRETDSIWFEVSDTASFQSYNFSIPRGQIRSVRLDPLSQTGTFTIRSLTVTSAHKALRLEGSRLAEALVPVNQVELSFDQGVVNGVSQGIDPYLVIDGSYVAAGHPAHIRIAVLSALLLLVAGAKKLYPQGQFQIAFALSLLLFSVQVMMPLYLSLFLAISSAVLFYFVKENSEIMPVSITPLPTRRHLKNERLTTGYWLALILLFAFLLRFWNLNILDPYTDEYSNLLAAKDYLETGDLEYTRAALVTYLVALFYRIGGAASFYEYLFWGRLPGVIFSALTVIPIYYLTRKISSRAALLSAFLWAVSPWAIGVAKTVREYAYYPLIVLLGALCLVKLLELPLVFNKKNIIYAFACLLPVLALIYYAFNVDRDSTLRICAVVYSGLVFFFSMKQIFNLKRLNKMHKIAVISIIVLSGSLIFTLMLGYAAESGHVSLGELKFSFYWLRVFLFPGDLSSPLHWWGHYSTKTVALFVLAVGFIHAALKNRGLYRERYFLHLTVFAVTLLFYLLFFDRYYRPRYIFYALPFFIPLVAAAVDALINFVQKMWPVRLKYICAAAVFIFFFQVFNYQNIFYPVFSAEHGYVKTTDEHHYHLGSTIDLLAREAVPDDYYIATIATGMLILSGIDKERISNYSFKREDRFEEVQRDIAENRQGFMILDWRRNGKFAAGFPHEGSFLIGDTLVTVIQNKDGMQIYRWKR